jgi:hypothetical protein
MLDKHETSISENVVREWRPPSKLGAKCQKIEQVFGSKYITVQVPLFRKSKEIQEMPLNEVRFFR